MGSSQGLAIPPSCKGVDPCTNVACQQALVKEHEITETDFQSRLIQSAGAPKVMTATEIQSIMDGGTCGTDGLRFDQNVQTNAELNPIAAPYDPAFVYYSFPFLKGVFLDNPDSFSFYLATGGSLGRDVIFSVTYLNATMSFFDCSNHWPSLPLP
ncbi:MAG: hypothetical protein JST06_00290 [Bacteroidetes bacterium]|nr:hypothetical protein [Bacteroidota bacterium]MBS1629954.1 hypothetical protein [Bacteroidota bacterium]